MSSIKAVCNVWPMPQGTNRQSGHSYREPRQYTWSFAAEFDTACHVDFVLIRHDFQQARLVSFLAERSQCPKEKKNSLWQELPQGNEESAGGPKNVRQVSAGFLRSGSFGDILQGVQRQVFNSLHKRRRML